MSKINLLLLALKLKHKLSNDVVDDLLKLCNHISDGESVSKTRYFFNQQFSSVTDEFLFVFLL